MNSKHKLPVFFVFVFAILMAFFVAATPAWADAPTLPEEFVLYGHDGDDWSGEWWQWAFSIPAATHPMNQDGNVDCKAEQRGRVWFLGGAFPGGPEHPFRNCTVPTNTYLWFPVLNWVMWRPGDFVTDQEGHDLADFYGDSIYDVVVTLNGESIPAYRYHSGIFPFHIQPGGVFEWQGDPSYPHLMPHQQYDGITDGYYTMLAPLPAGEYELKFSASSQPDPNFPPFSIDVTYNLTVEEPGD